MGSMMIGRIRNQKGLSMLEAVLGVLVISVGFLGLIPLMSSATANALSSDHNVTSTFLGEELAETLIADKQFRGYNYIVNANYPAQQMTGNLSQYRRSVNITEVNQTDLTTPQAGSGYKRIDVTVTWNSSQSVVTTTLLTNY